MMLGHILTQKYRVNYIDPFLLVTSKRPFFIIAMGYERFYNNK